MALHASWETDKNVRAFRWPRFILAKVLLLEASQRHLDLGVLICVGMPLQYSREQECLDDD